MIEKVYQKLKSLVLPILRISDAEPHPPAGHDPHEFMQTLRASPRYLAYRLFFWRVYACVWIVGVVSAATVITIIEPWWGLVAIPLAIVALWKTAVLYVTTRMDYEMRWYIVTDRSLLIREGVWEQREITLTFANAQNVHVKQGPVQRIFGISNVEVDTAGGGGKSREEKGTHRHRAVIRGIEDPIEIRDRILSLLRHHRTAGLGDPDDATTGHRRTLSMPVALLQEILTEVQVLRGHLQRGTDA